jgi:hypothetical protein
MKKLNYFDIEIIELIFQNLSKNIANFNEQDISQNLLNLGKLKAICELKDETNEPDSESNNLNFRIKKKILK